MEVALPDLMWIVILGFIIGFCLAFGVGANDVANSFGTSVGSKVLTLRQACILATIFEILGAMLLGYKVSSTIRTGIIDVEMYSMFEKELMLGYLAALGGSAIWNLMATFLRWPISGTHSIVGAVVGFSLVSRGFYSIRWLKLGQIVASWFLSPVMSGGLSFIIFYIVKKAILSKENFIERGYISLPFFYGFTVLVNVFSCVHNGPSYLGFDQIPWWGVLILSIIAGIITGLCIWYILVPYLQSSDSSGNSTPEESESSRSPIKNGGAAVTSTNTEVENPAFEENGNVALEEVTTISLPQENSHAINDDVIKPEEDDAPESRRMFSALQVLTAIFGSFAHGANDVSNAIGPVVGIWLVYIYGDVDQKGTTPPWILLYGGVGISVGLWMWGQKVIKTIGEDLTKITPSSGFTIEIGAATTVLVASKIGLPISTTHCKVGSVVFVGWAKSRASVDWKLFRNIVLAWILTLPISGGLSGMLMLILKTATNS